MKIRTSLTLRFTVIVALILLLFSVTVYYASLTDREQMFRSRLHDRAMNTARLLLNVEEVSPDLLQIIEKNTITLPEENIAIFDPQGKIVFNTPDRPHPDYSPALIKALREGEDEIKSGTKDVESIVFPAAGAKYLIIAEANDKYGYLKMRNLRNVLMISYLLSVGLTLLAGWFYSGQALKPISKVVNEVEGISASNLSTRVDTGNKKDEIAQLAITFNNMLARLESSFEMQRSFVSNASHELRTPLTAITGQIEVTLMKERSQEEYETILRSTLEDIRNLNRLSNGLLDLAQASLDITLLRLTPCRIDEILFQARTDLIKMHPDFQVSISIDDMPEDEAAFTLTGSQALLKTTFLNIMENGCKFSPGNSVDVKLEPGRRQLKLIVEDEGPGIPVTDLPQVFQPFFRSANVAGIKGHGLGLSLSKKIIDLHRGTLELLPRLPKGTRVEIILPTNA